MLEGSLSKSAHWRWFAGLVLGIVLLSVYYPVLTFEYLFHDDWLSIHARKSTCDTFPMYRYIQLRGTPLGPYVHCGLFRLFQTIDAAGLARLAIIGGIVAFAFLQTIYFQLVGIKKIAAISLAIGTSVLPGMLVAAYWITAGGGVFVLLPSATAALLTAAALQPGTGVTRRAAFLVGACGLELTSLLMSQVSAMYFWTLTAVMLATALSRDGRTAVRSLAVYGLVGGAPMAGYFIWYKYVSGLVPLLQAEDPLRGTMFSDLAGNAKWFFDAALPRASLLWFFDLSRGFGVAALVVFVLSLLLFSARMCWMAWRREDRTGSVLCAAYPLLIVGLGIAAFLPMLVTAFHLAVFRSMVSLSALMFLTGAIHLGVLLRAERWPPVIRICVAAGFVLGLCVVAGNSLIIRMVLPAAAEYSYVRSSLWDAAQSGRVANRVHVVVPRRTGTGTTDEMDNLSVQFPQDVEPMVQSIGRGLRLPAVPVSSSRQGEPFDPEGALILDLTQLSRSGLWKSFRTVVTDEDIARLPPVETIDLQPRLLRSRAGYNLVSYRGQIYAVPQSLGPIMNWETVQVGKLPGVVTGSTVEDVLARLPK